MSIMAQVANSIQTFQTLPLAPRTQSSALRTRYLAKVARDKKTKEDAYLLRYASYLDGGFIRPNSTKLFSDSYDNLNSSSTIVVYENQRAVASVRVCLMSDQASGISPAADAFPDEVRGLLQIPVGNTNACAAEINRLVRSPEAANNQGLVFLLYRLAGLILLNSGVKVILSCVRQNHLSFYKRIRFSQLAGPRNYPGLKCSMYLLAGSREDYDIVRSTFPLMDPDTLPTGSFVDFLAGEPLAAPLTGLAGE